MNNDDNHDKESLANDDGLAAAYGPSRRHVTNFDPDATTDANINVNNDNDLGIESLADDNCLAAGGGPSARYAVNSNPDANADDSASASADINVIIDDNDDEAIEDIDSLANDACLAGGNGPSARHTVTDDHVQSSFAAAAKVAEDDVIENSIDNEPMVQYIERAIELLLLELEQNLNNTKWTGEQEPPPPSSDMGTFPLHTPC